jgi:hypothetical protein|tara:strand:+ start:614 stop:844 length:231 start_codon:yes stop_codon:yes gene_type:complete
MTKHVLAKLDEIGHRVSSIRSGSTKVGSGNLVWRSQGALDAAEGRLSSATDVQTIASEQNFSGEFPEWERIPILMR